VLFIEQHLLTVIQIIHMTLMVISPVKHTGLTRTFPTFWRTHRQHIPRDEWEKLSQEERDRVMANNCNGSPKQFPPPRHANMHAVEDFVDLESIVDYAVMKHDTAHVNTDDNKIADNEGTALLSYMSGQQSSCGDV
jgi:hypothetical protein